jgi:hypothetical protein
MMRFTSRRISTRRLNPVKQQSAVAVAVAVADDVIAQRANGPNPSRG